MKIDFKHICILFLIATVTSFADSLELSIRNEVAHSQNIAFNWLFKVQKENGSWEDYPAITALVITSMLKSDSDLKNQEYDHIERGLQYIINHQKKDGSITLGDLPVYNTAICINALVAANNSKFAVNIKRARDYLIRMQIDEEEGYDKSHPYYGGIGYGNDGRPDLSNLQSALEALKASEEYKDLSEATGERRIYSEENTATKSNYELFWDKAIIFLQRCQNLKSVNDSPWAGNDGGFVYMPGSDSTETEISKAGGYTSYGSMSYAGLKSYIYAHLNKNDERVIAVFNWLREHYTVEENPQMGNQGLYYYYYTMAKALNAYGEDFINIDGEQIDWRKELAIKLLSIQNEEGWWQNENGRWWENNKVLCTAYSLLAYDNILIK